MVIAEAADGRRETAARAAVAQVVDPEIPVLTIEDLGVLREVVIEGERVIVTVTPTYSGCPAMDAIRDQISGTLFEAGWVDVEIRTMYAPAWTTEWMSEEGKRKLEAHGIAPPGGATLCPRCRSGQVTTISEFGSTACKALMRCVSCGEPFDRFKDL